MPPRITGLDCWAEAESTSTEIEHGPDKIAGMLSKPLPEIGNLLKSRSAEETSA